MNLPKSDSFRIGVIITLLVLFPASVFAVGSSASALTQSMSTNDSLINEPTVAKHADCEAALDPNVSPTRQETFLNQMNKANRAIKELRHGFPISQSELDDAFWVPPKLMTARDRARLITQLKQVLQRDDTNEQQMLNDLVVTYSVRPDQTRKFDRRKAEINRLIKDLEIGEPVHYTDLNEAFAVIPSPY